MGADRLPHVQRMILADSSAERVEPLSHIQKMQEADFYGILKAMHGLPVTIRLLDPPLHEFLPNYESVLVETIELRITGKDPARLAQQEALLAKIRELHEFNPMLGHRGCRLGITFPDVYDMQVRAILNASVKLTKEGVKVLPEIEIPLTIDFKDVGVNKVDGINYRLPMNYTITCAGSTLPWEMVLTVKGTASSFESAAVQSSVTDLGIKLLQNGQPFQLNTPIVINPATPPALEAVPVKRPGSTLKSGGFSAAATLMAEYQ